VGWDALTFGITFTDKRLQLIQARCRGLSPEFPPATKDSDRPASALLVSQTQHLPAALSKHLAEVQSVLAVDINALVTEKQIGEYVRRATALLHPQAARRAGK
jgi:hypothetical protein